MPAARGHAVVVGASMAGLMAARVLAEHFERVTVVDRDRLPTLPEARRGVPQGRHVHVLLVRGRQVLEELFPGLVEDLLARGALTGDLQRDARLYVDGHLVDRRPIGIGGLLVSRPLLEDRVRARVQGEPRVEVLEGTDLVEPVVVDGRVNGVRVMTAAGERVLPADLLVDATGRGSHTPAWLRTHGYEAPAEDRVEVGIRYTTWLLPRRPGDLDGDPVCLVGATAAVERFGAATAIEGDRWLVTAGGYAGVPAPQEQSAFRDFLAGLAVPDLATLMDDREPLAAPSTHRFPGSLRRRYERVPRLPEGLVVIGDALSSFNPVYGQGMTVAAVEALLLGRLVADGRPDLARRFHRAAARVVDVPWDTAAGTDLRLPSVPGDGPLRTRLVNRYLARLQAAAAVDGDVAAAFLRVLHLLDPPSSLLRPAVVARVMWPARRRPPAARTAVPSSAAAAIVPPPRAPGDAAPSEESAGQA